MHHIMHSGLASVRMISKKTLTQLHFRHFSRKSIPLSPFELSPKGLQSYILELSFCNLSHLFAPVSTKTACSASMAFFSTSSDRIVWRYRSSCNTMPELADNFMMSTRSMVSIHVVLSVFYQNEYPIFHEGTGSMILKTIQTKESKTFTAYPWNFFFPLFGWILLILSLTASCTPQSKDVPQLKGTVNIAPNVPLWMLHGDLSIVVFMKGSTSPAYLPVAISIYPHPVFPLTFSIDQDNVRLSGIKLAGNVKVQARLKLSGNQQDYPSTLYTSGTPSDGVVDGQPVSLTISQESHP